MGSEQYWWLNFHEQAYHRDKRGDGISASIMKNSLVCYLFFTFLQSMNYCFFFLRIVRNTLPKHFVKVTRLINQQRA